MDDYKNSLFNSVIWLQGVEGLVLDCILKLVDQGKLSCSNKELNRIKHVYGLGGLARAIEPAVTKELFEKIFALSRDRNYVAHRAANDYLIHILSGSTRTEMEMDQRKLHSITVAAGDVFGELLDFHESLCN